MAITWDQVSKFFIAGTSHDGVLLRVFRARGHPHTFVELVRYLEDKAKRKIGIRVAEFRKIATFLRRVRDSENISLEEGRHLQVSIEKNKDLKIAMDKQQYSEMFIPATLLEELCLNIELSCEVLKLGHTRTSVRNPIIAYVFTYILGPLLSGMKSFRGEVGYQESKDALTKTQISNWKVYDIFEQHVQSLMIDDKVNEMARMIFAMTGRDMKGDIDLVKDAYAIYGEAHTILLGDNVPDSMGGMARAGVRRVLELIEKTNIF